MALSNAIHLRGSRASQPAAAAKYTGVLYFVTDEKILERCSGVAWESYDAGSASLTALTGDVTATGPGSAVATIAARAVTPGKLFEVTDQRLVGRFAGTDGDAQLVEIGAGLELTVGGVLQATAISIESITCHVGDGSATLTTGIKGYLYIPSPLTITGWTILSVDAAGPTVGSVVFDIWVDSFANFPPTVLDTITASDKPTLTTGTKVQDTALTGWSAVVAGGSIMGFKIDSVTALTEVMLILTVVEG